MLHTFYNSSPRAKSNYATLYRFEVYLPKKNMENAPDLEDFEFTDGEDEETENEDDTYTEDE